MSSCTSCGETKVGVYRKRSRTIRVTINGMGDLTGAKVWFSVKEEDDDADADALIEKKSLNNGGADTEALVTVPYVADANGDMVGIVEVYLVPADTENIPSGNYRWDMVVETSAGRRLEAVVPSRFEVWQPVTLT